MGRTGGCSRLQKHFGTDITALQQEYRGKGVRRGEHKYRNEECFRSGSDYRPYRDG